MSALIPGEEWRQMEEAIDQRSSADDAALNRARTGIREHRMRDVAIRILDHTGRPCPGQEVDLVQLKHAFPFGDQVWHLDALIRDGRGDGEQARAWKQRFREVFNASTNLCYWTERSRNDASKTEDQQGDCRLDNVAQTIDWTCAEGMLAKGHPLFWSIPKCWPAWLNRYDTAKQMMFAEVRVRNLVARFRGKVRIWDAVNEPMWEAAPQNMVHRQWPHIEPIANIVGYVAPVLRWCREEDPEALFLLNDYGMEADSGAALTGSDGSPVSAASQRRRYLALAAALGDAGTSADGIGLQSHTGGWQTPSAQTAIYDEFAAGGLPIHITEFWAETRAMRESGRYTDTALEQLTADYIVDYLTCAFGHPGVDAFFFWGFMNSAIRWHGTDSSHEPTVIFERVLDLLNRQWRSHESGITDANGCLAARLFHGSYSARIAGRGHPFVVSPTAAMPLSIVV